jgi:hypothetical protein
VLQEKGVSRERLKNRAAALEKMGDIFVEVGKAHKEISIPGEDSQSKQQMAQDRIEKAMQDTLEKMDKADQDAYASSSPKQSAARSHAEAP